MKVFQILNGFCYYDMTKEFPTLESTKGRFARNIHIVEAPDYVFAGWGYDPDAEGDTRFLQPEPPEGWIYDETTGTFAPQLSNKEKRERAYELEKIISYEGVMITVDEANRKYWNYAVEDNIEKTAEITALVIEAKNKIREMYPDETVA